MFQLPREMEEKTLILLLALSALLITDVSVAQRRNLRNFQNFQQNSGLTTGYGIGSSNQAARFYLYSRESNQRVELFHNDLNVLFDAGFNSSVDTKFIVHGWNSHSNDQYTNTLANAYLDHTDVNVVALDYTRMGGTNTQYQSACRNVHSVGRHSAQFIDWLVTDVGVSMDSVHLIGYSLGSHVAGAVGEHVSAGQVGRITGLDSAGPGFFNAGTSGRLDASDAQFVDAIHTCGGTIGYAGAHGHADFYPNGGSAQPGCNGNSGCAHSRSYQMFAESISSTGFVSRACNNWQSFVNGFCNGEPQAIMGEHVDRSARGDFFLYTAARSPYALG